MSAEERAVNFDPIPLDGLAGVMTLRIVATAEKPPVAVFGRTQKPSVGPFYETEILGLSLVSGNETSKQIALISQLLPAPPAWDIIHTEETSLGIVLERSGGAINNLILMISGREEVEVSVEYPFEHFSLPRFARGSKGSWPIISAIVDNREAVVFFPQGARRYGRYTVLQTCSRALVLRTDDYFVLIFKIDTAGPARFDVVPGTLFRVALNSDLSFAETPQPLLEDQQVFEFDADVHAGMGYIFATTAQGVALIRAGLPDKSFVSLPVKGPFRPDAVSQPSVAVTLERIHLTMIENPKTEQARLYYAQHPLISLP